MAKATAKTKYIDVQRMVTRLKEVPDGVTLELTQDEAQLIFDVISSAECPGTGVMNIYEAMRIYCNNNYNRSSRITNHPILKGWKPPKENH